MLLADNLKSPVAAGANRSKWKVGRSYLRLCGCICKVFEICYRFPHTLKMEITLLICVYSILMEVTICMFVYFYYVYNLQASSLAVKVYMNALF